MDVFLFQNKYDPLKGLSVIVHSKLHFVHNPQTQNYILSTSIIWTNLIFWCKNTYISNLVLNFTPGGGTQYKSGYRDVPQTWVAKSGRQVHQWVPFFSKTWYFDGSIFQNFLKFAPKWRKFGTLIGQLFKIFRNLRQNGANFSEKF